MQRAGLLITRSAKVYSPVDMDKLRASIAPTIRIEREGVVLAVGSPVKYAPYMELGTKPHWPPPGALAVWARRHNISEFLVRRAIARRGTAPRKYLERGFKDNENEVRALLGKQISWVINQK